MRVILATGLVLAFAVPAGAGCRTEGSWERTIAGKKTQFRSLNLTRGDVRIETVSHVAGDILSFRVFRPNGSRVCNSVQSDNPKCNVHISGKQEGEYRILVKNHEPFAVTYDLQCSNR